MNKITFKKHEENIKKFLDLDETVKVLVGEEADNYVDEHKEIYKERHKEELESKYKKVNGIFLWWENENTILIKSEEKIGTLAHELRHAWQYKNKKYKFKIPKTKYQKNKEKVIYFVSSKELDAHKYAKNYCRDINEEEGVNKAKINIVCIYILRSAVGMLLIFFCKILYVWYNVLRF